MKYITEEILRLEYRNKPYDHFQIPEGARLTPGAHQFLRDFQIKWDDAQAVQVGSSVDQLDQGETEKSQDPPEDFRDGLLSASYKLKKIAYQLHPLDKMAAREVHHLGELLENMDFSALDQATGSTGPMIEAAKMNPDFKPDSIMASTILDVLSEVMEIKKWEQHFAELSQVATVTSFKESLQQGKRAMYSARQFILALVSNILDEESRG